jgi:hypothetical protein
MALYLLQASGIEKHEKRLSAAWERNGAVLKSDSATDCRLSVRESLEP